MGSLYVVSDVHGHLDDFRRGVDRLGVEDELWVLGDLLDRGPDGFGVVDTVMRLQQESPGRVQVLLGNHEALAVGRYRFPGSKFEDSWRVNGGRDEDQSRLRDEHVAWLASLPAMACVRDHLLVHSDTTGYSAWGGSVDEVNATVRHALSDATDLEAHWEVWARLTRRYEFAGSDGPAVARGMLTTYGGQRIVHGHTPIGLLLDEPSARVTQPLLYADGLVLDVDGGRYDGGPLLFVNLDRGAPSSEVRRGAGPR